MGWGGPNWASMGSNWAKPARGQPRQTGQPGAKPDETGLGSNWLGTNWAGTGLNWAKLVMLGWNQARSDRVQPNWEGWN